MNKGKSNLKKDDIGVKTMERLIHSVSVGKSKGGEFVLRIGTEAFIMDKNKAGMLCSMFAIQLGYVLHKKDRANENSTKGKPLGG